MVNQWQLPVDIEVVFIILRFAFTSIIIIIYGAFVHFSITERHEILEILIYIRTAIGKQAADLFMFCVSSNERISLKNNELNYKLSQ